MAAGDPAERDGGGGQGRRTHLLRIQSTGQTGTVSYLYAVYTGIPVNSHMTVVEGRAAALTCSVYSLQDKQV